MELYRWQKNALAAWKAHQGQGIVQAATGTGKTALAMVAMDEMLREHPWLTIRIVTPTIPLARQWSEALQRHMDFFFSHGSLYKVMNGNLMFHGGLPMDEEGNFRDVTLWGKTLKGRAYMDWVVPAA